MVLSDEKTSTNPPENARQHVLPGVFRRICWRFLIGKHHFFAQCFCWTIRNGFVIVVDVDRIEFWNNHQEMLHRINHYFDGFNKKSSTKEYIFSKAAWAALLKTYSFVGGISTHKVWLETKNTSLDCFQLHLMFFFILYILMILTSYFLMFSYFVLYQKDLTINMILRSMGSYDQ